MVLYITFNSIALKVRGGYSRLGNPTILFLFLFPFPILQYIPYHHYFPNSSPDVLYSFLPPPDDPGGGKERAHGTMLLIIGYDTNQKEIRYVRTGSTGTHELFGPRSKYIHTL
ncbi:hypothetical protein K449DRAFT_138224 [Hypoxylon sp. EC38]|nr:hypothetical protein K449DRAFT_138224 [Hypoxylon sp. EC38]